MRPCRHAFVPSPCHPIRPARCAANLAIRLVNRDLNDARANSGIGGRAVQIHYEIFRRVGAKGGWTLHEVMSSREKAIQIAQGLMASEKATGVKVVKETYNEDTGDYLSLKILEEGLNQVKIE